MEPRRLLVYGDSNTHGTAPMARLGDIGRFDRATRWTGPFARALAPGWEVIDEGHPGRTTVHDDPIEGPHRNGLRILPAILESHRPLDLVLVMLGTNDLKARFSVGPADIAQGLERLAREIRVSGCGPGGGAPAVLLVAPPPIAETGCLAEIFAGGAAKSRGLGAAVRAAAGRCGAACVDAATLVAVSDLDGIHFEPAAHAALAEGLARAVRAEFG